jgi:hypothetical protein
MDLNLKDLRKQLSGMEKDDILKWFGVEERRTAADYIVPAVGLFSVGLLLGAGLGLMLAPKSGRELRADLRTRLGAEEMSNGAADLGQRVQERIS